MIDYREKHAILNRVAKEFQNFTFTGGLNEERRYCIFVYKGRKETSIPGVGETELFSVEVGGSSEKDVEVLMAKIALVCA